MKYKALTAAALILTITAAGCTTTTKTPREDDQAMIARLQAELATYKAVRDALAEERLRQWHEWMMMEGRRPHRPSGT